MVRTDRGAAVNAASPALERQIAEAWRATVPPEYRKRRGRHAAVLRNLAPAESVLMACEGSETPSYCQRRLSGTISWLRIKYRYRFSTHIEGDGVRVTRLK
jgi:hypothetical protein